MADSESGVPVPGIKRVQTDDGNKAQRLLRVDQIYSRKDRQTHFVKTAKVKPRPDRAGKTALVVRRIISKKGVVSHVEVDIKSEVLAEVMKEFYKDAEGMSLNKTPPMASPTHFFWARKYLYEVKEAEKKKASPSQFLIDDIGTALRFIAEDWGGVLQDLETLLPAGDITFDLLWSLFPLDEPVLIPRYGGLGCQQVLYLQTSDYGQREDGSRFFGVQGEILSFDGDDFGRATIGTEIDAYEGAKKITTLDGFPLRMHPDADSIQEELTERGKKFISYIKKPVYKDYTAQLAVKSLTMPNGREAPVKVEAKGRVMIDPVAFRYYGDMTSLCQPWVYTSKVIRSFDGLTDKQYLVCASWVNGFFFGSKQWASFDVSKFADTKWNDDAFSKLAVAESRRRIVHGLVKAHRNDDGDFDDFIQNKGKGMVGLLSGNPGVGKTSTAEAVAEVTHRPLYQASGGELGMDPDQVDRRLEVILDITRRWSAVLLIDEADVFLVQRGKTVAQDTLVSIFLRRIEYFQGVLILTTNRREEIDHAFRSRIHFTLHYPDLDEGKRLHIWNLFLAGRTDVLDVSEADIAQLAKRNLNGREIKNATSCILSLSRHDQKRMNIKEINELLDVIFGG